MKNIIQALLLLTLMTGGIVLGIQLARELYIEGYNNGYEACVEEYNLYLPFE